MVDLLFQLQIRPAWVLFNLGILLINKLTDLIYLNLVLPLSSSLSPAFQAALVTLVDVQTENQAHKEIFNLVDDEPGVTNEVPQRNQDNQIPTVYSNSMQSIYTQRKEYSRT